MAFDVISYSLAKSVKADTANLMYGNKVIARHTYLESLMASIYLDWMVLGDSIGAGAGASTYTKCWFWLVAGLLQTKFNRGSTSDWAAKVCSTGGQCIPNVIPYVSHNLSATPDQTMPTLSAAYSYPLWVICMGRNDCTLFNIADFRKLYRLAVRQGIRAGIDVICLTEPPQINTSNWTVNDPNYAPFYAAIKEIAESEGASLVDINKDFSEQYSKGVSPQTLMADSAHPNDAGHERIANLVYSCIISNSISKTKKVYSDGNDLLKCVPQTQFNMGTDEAVTVVTANTARGLWNNGTITARKVTAGNTLTVTMPSVDWDYMIVTFINKLSTGTATIQAASGYSVKTGVTFDPTNSQEMSEFVKCTATDTLSKGSVGIVAVGGDVYVSGITIIGPEVTTIHPKIVGTEVGTWTDATLYSTCVYRRSSTIGDTITVKWYGTNLFLCVARTASSGKFSLTTDGGTPVTFDMYSATVSYEEIRGHYEPLALGYHTTVITVVEKNASSSNNLVNIKELIICSTVNNDGSVIARGNAGINIYSNFPFNWVETEGDFTIAANKVTVTEDSWVKLVNLS